jgi:heme-degrading monooxygenase HmoA
MYIVTSLWKFGNAEQARLAMARFRDNFGPLIGAQAGLRGWYLMIPSADEAVTVTIWESLDAFDAARPHLEGWSQRELAGVDARVQYRRRGGVAAHQGGA